MAREVRQRCAAVRNGVRTLAETAFQAKRRAEAYSSRAARNGAPPKLRFRPNASRRSPKPCFMRSNARTLVKATFHADARQNCVSRGAMRGYSPKPCITRDDAHKLAAVVSQVERRVNARQSCVLYETARDVRQSRVSRGTTRASSPQPFSKWSGARTLGKTAFHARHRANARKSCVHVRRRAQAHRSRISRKLPRSIHRSCVLNAKRARGSFTRALFVWRFIVYTLFRHGA